MPIEPWDLSSAIYLSRAVYERAFFDNDSSSIERYLSGSNWRLVDFVSNGNAQAMLVQHVNDVRKFSLVFRGSEVDIRDGVIHDFTEAAWDQDDHYGKFSGFITRVNSLLHRSNAGDLLVTGHSLGGAMAEIYVNNNAAALFNPSLVTFGSPGTQENALEGGHTVVSKTDGNVLHIHHSEDGVATHNIPAMPFNFGGPHQGSVVTVDRQDLSSGTYNTTEHASLNYQSTVEYLRSSSVLYDIFSSDPAAYSVTIIDGVSYIFGNGGGHSGKDYIIGTSNGDPQIDGGAGNDLIHGNSGQDTIIGGAGDDTIHGGTGSDTAVYSHTLSADNYVAFHNTDGSVSIRARWGDEGTDTLYSIEEYRFALQTYTESEIFQVIGSTGGGGGGTGGGSGGGGGSTINYVLGTTGSDDLRNRDTSGADYIDALGGDDFLQGGAEIDWLDGDSGFDTVDYSDRTGVRWVIDLNHTQTLTNPVTGSQGSWGTATLYNSTSGGTSSGTEHLQNIEAVIGSSGNDQITGNNAANRLEGRSGNDTLRGGGGNDTLIGGAGRDTLDGGTGSDTADYSLNTARGTIHLDTGSAQFSGFSYSETLTSIENVLLGSGDDTIYLSGQNINNRVDGGDGTDIVYLTYQYNSGYEVSGSSGNLTISGSAGTDQFINIQNFHFSDGSTHSASEVLNPSTGGGGGSGGGGGTTNSAPTKISLSSNRVNENSSSGTLVGTLSATDPDDNSGFTYTLTNNPGGRFYISGNGLYVNSGANLDYEAQTSHLIGVQVRDPSGNTYSEDTRIYLNNLNDTGGGGGGGSSNQAPTGIRINGGFTANVNENSANGTVVASLSAIDPDDSSGFSYALLDTAGGRFGISGDQLVVANGSLLDFETSDNHIVRIQVTDPDGATYNDTYRIRLNDLPDGNQPPTVTLSNTLSNSQEGTYSSRLKVADINVSDDGQGSNNLSLSGSDASLFEIYNNDLYLRAGVTLDYETNPSLDVTVRVDDPTVGSAPDDTVSLTVSVLNVNEAPTNVTLSGTHRVDENSMGTVIGSLNTSDPDTGDTHAYTLSDNRFEVVGNQLRLKEGIYLDYEITPTIDLTVTTSDSEGLSHSQIFTIAVGNLATGLTLAGGNEPDNWSGTQESDTFRGNGGNDRLLGGEGNDKLYGQTGNDTLKGGLGADRLEGGSGNDKINGGDDRDIIKGDDGADLLRGDGGNDSMNGGNDHDIMYGDTGSDYMRGDGGNDKMYGGDHNDTMLGDLGSDYMRGGSGNDKIYGGSHNDTMLGDLGSDYMRGGSGNDKIYGGDHNDTLLGDIGSDYMRGGSGNDKIYGGDHNDTMLGDIGSDYMRGGSGNDKIYGGHHNDTLLGDIGSDYMRGGSGNDKIYGGDHNDTLIGDIGADRLYGGGGNDHLYFDASDILVDGGAGWDIGYASGEVNLASVGLTDIEQIIGSRSVDRFDGSGLTEDIRLHGEEGADILTGGNAGDIIKGDDGADLLRGDGGNDKINGGNDHDILYGDTGSDYMRGDGGNDKIYGGDHNDTMLGDLGSDYMRGGSGNDKMYGGGHNDTMLGDIGSDYMRGGSGNDKMYGGDHNDTLIGDIGSDYMRGGSGNDKIYGGHHNDTMLGDIGSDYMRGGSGNDKIYGGDHNDTMLGDIGSDYMRGGSGNDKMYGGDHNDTMLGDIGSDYMRGGSGNDKLYGGAGIDIIYGDIGADEIHGGTGDDIIEGGSGNDRIYGDAGNDIFVFGDDWGDDIIYSYADNADSFRMTAVTGLTNFSQLSVTQAGADTLVSYNGDSFTLVNIDHTILTDTDFLL